MTQTNAQVALMAAATAFQGRMKSIIAPEVLGLADQYKRWLDQQEPKPTVLNARGDLDPRPGPKHFVTTNKITGLAVCHCGWNPFVELPLTFSGISDDQVKQLVQDHVAENKP